MTSFNLKYFLKGSTPNAVTVGLGLQHMNLGGDTIHLLASQEALVIKNCLPMQETLRDAILIPGLGRSPGGGNDNLIQHSCLEKIPGTEEPGWLQAIGSQRARDDWSNLTRPIQSTVRGQTRHGKGETAAQPGGSWHHTGPRNHSTKSLHLAAGTLRADLPRPHWRRRDKPLPPTGLSAPVSTVEGMRVS